MYSWISLGRQPIKKSVCHSCVRISWPKMAAAHGVSTEPIAANFSNEIGKFAWISHVLSPV